MHALRVEVLDDANDTDSEVRESCPSITRIHAEFCERVGG